MKRQNALTLLIILSIFTITFGANPANIRANPPQMSIYQDPGGQFTEIVPTNWRAENKGTYGLLTDPDGKIKVYVLAVEGNDLQAAVRDAWKSVAPDATHDLTGVNEVVSNEGIEKTVQFTFTSMDPQQQVTATAELYQNRVYMILVEADVIAALNRNSQLNVITRGLSITGLKLVNLAGTKPLDIDKAMTDKFETFINETLPELGIPGLEVAIVQNGKIVYTKGFGVTVLGGNDPVTPQTMMMLGSVTKSMTTMMMATVVDDRKMSWDTPVVKVMPQFVLSDSERTRTLTMRELVCACIGLERHDAVFFFRGATFTPDQLVQSLETKLTKLCPSGPCTRKSAYAALFFLVGDLRILSVSPVPLSKALLWRFFLASRCLNSSFPHIN